MHTIRHLIDQVKKIGPLWLVSAFPFESANHMVTRTVKGFIKNPDKIVHNFLLQQRSLESKKTINTSLYCKLNHVNQAFATANNRTQIKSRYFSQCVYISASFTYNKTNISNIFSQLISKRFVRIEFFAKNAHNVEIIVVRFYRSKQFNDFFRDLSDSDALHFKIGKPENLEITDVAELQWKCVLLESSKDVYMVSVMREGFEHN